MDWPVGCALAAAAAFWLGAWVGSLWGKDSVKTIDNDTLRSEVDAEFQQCKQRVDAILNRHCGDHE